MYATNQKIKQCSAAIVLLVTTAFVMFAAVPAAAQCTSLSAGACVNHTTIPQHHDFTQTSGYWAVVGVSPQFGDDKDIIVREGCDSGNILAASQGTSGADFVIADFNHTPLGTYYATSTFGPTAPHDVLWLEGAQVLPIGPYVSGTIGGTGSACAQMEIWDIYLEQGAEYRFRFSPGAEGRLALFHNPGGIYWNVRSGSEFELAGFSEVTYVAPQDDWYGLVVFAHNKLATQEVFGLEVERLDDCVTLAPRDCESHQLYTPFSGPTNDFQFTQEFPYWTAVAVSPDTLDNNSLEIFSQCDENGTQLGGSYASGTGDTDLIVGDFNHNPLGDAFVRVRDGDTALPYTIEWDTEANIFPIPGHLVGYMSNLIGDCEQVLVWDVFMEAGKQYEFFFYEWGQRDPTVALFRNPTSAPYWGGRADAEFERSSQGYEYYTAPQTDWYGMVVFANARKTHGSLHQVDIQEMGDCIPLTSGQCETTYGYGRDFSYVQTGPYWGVVGVAPSETDYKVVHAFTQCDAKGTLLDYSLAAPGFVVADFNHTPTGTYYAHVANGDLSDPFTINCDTGSTPSEDMFPHDVIVSGTLGGESGDCGVVKIWDLYLEAGKTYNIGFTASKPSGAGLTLFRNPGNGTFWADDQDGEWEMYDTGVETYTAPATDWYGLVVFTLKRELPGSYTIRVSEEGVTGIDDDVAPSRFALGQNAPNPFNPSTIIAYDVPAGGGHVTLDVFDAAGRRVRSLVDDVLSPGHKQAVWDGRNDRGVEVASGVYFYRMTAPEFNRTLKMVLLR